MLFLSFPMAFGAFRTALVRMPADLWCMWPSDGSLARVVAFVAFRQTSSVCGLPADPFRTQRGQGSWVLRGPLPGVLQRPTPCCPEGPEADGPRHRPAACCSVLSGGPFRYLHTGTVLQHGVCFRTSLVRNGRDTGPPQYDFQSGLGKSAFMIRTFLVWYHNSDPCRMNFYSDLSGLICLPFGLP